MTEFTPLIVALLGTLGLIGAAIIAAVASAWVWAMRRMLRAEAHTNQLWRYTRDLIDHIYRERGAPPPEPPESIRHLYESGDPA